MKIITKLILTFIVIFTVTQSYGQQTHRITFWPSSIADTKQACPIAYLKTPLGGYWFGNNPGLPMDDGTGNIIMTTVVQVGQTYPWTQMWLIDSVTENHLINPRVDTVRVRIPVNIGTGTISVKLYSVDGSTGQVTSELGESDPVNIAGINTAAGVFTSFGFSNPVQIDDDLFGVGVVLSQQNGDTICIANSTCTEFNGNSWLIIETGGNQYFLTVDKSLQAGGQFIETDLAIVPDMVFDVDNNAGVSNMNGVRVFKTYPNPVSDNLNLDFQLSNSDNIEVSVINVSGQVTKVASYNNLSSGLHNKSINVSNFPSGFYMYEISSNTGKTYGKFVIE